ncbi:hypothetical protein DPMN_029864 [Dreissena polymorpha]|uniref:Uncharacterized protein n=1 Tax=Dreissena polymorpha TaxID=45954 RepID=A0A9D4LX78_DREPO|nr:hypothetical protein DPMN_029864 [Dreissena polymorpha]
MVRWSEDEQRQSSTYRTLKAIRMGIIEKSMHGEQRCIQRDADETTMMLVTSEDIEQVFDDRTTVDQASFTKKHVFRTLLIHCIT